MGSIHHSRLLLVAVALAALGLAGQARSQAATLDEGDLRELQDWAQPAQPHANAGMPVYPSRLLLVGVSDKGVLAMLQYLDDDMLPVWTLILIDLVTDSMLVERRWEDPEGEIGIEGLIDAHGDEILADLAANGITSEPLTLESFTLDDDAGAFTLDVADDGIFLAAPTRAAKRIAKVNSVSDVPDVLGYVASPHERRIAVVIRVYEPGVEGTTHTRFQIAGAHLDTGFTDDSDRLQATPRFQAFVETLEGKGLHPEDGAQPRLGAPAETTLAEYVPGVVDGATARFGYTLRERESIGGGLYREVVLEEWQYSSARQARAAYDALTAAQGSQSDTTPLWKMPHSFAVEGRYVYRLHTRAHAFIPLWKEVRGMLQADLGQ